MTLDFAIRRLILASGSPRRRELISLLGLPFVIRAANVDERWLDGESPPEMVVRLSQAKARSIGDARRDELVIAADTVVALDGQVLGKPVSPGEAAQMLRLLRGRLHHVYSGISAWHPASGRLVSELADSAVWMREYGDDEIARYVGSGDPLDKAGAYAIQHPAFDPVARVEGCWLSVMGLPLCHLGRALAQFGVSLDPDAPGICRAFSQRDCSMPLLPQRQAVS
ncbi:MAG: septum formation protein Maf [Anaerolineae bacterium]|nr:septum formation protein Maf [Anaerolineae bacterium]